MSSKSNKTSLFSISTNKIHAQSSIFFNYWIFNLVKRILTNSKMCCQCNFVNTQRLMKTNKNIFKLQFSIGYFAQSHPNSQVVNFYDSFNAKKCLHDFCVIHVFWRCFHQYLKWNEMRIEENKLKKITEKSRKFS